LCVALAFFGVLIFFTVFGQWLGHLSSHLAPVGLLLNFLSLPLAVFIAYRTFRWRSGVKCAECRVAGKWINEDRSGYIKCLACDGMGRVKPDNFFGLPSKNKTEPFVNGPIDAPRSDDWDGPRGRHGY
jgi:hypothetical protein